MLTQHHLNRHFAASHAFTWYKTAVLESKSRTGTRLTKKITISYYMYVFCLSCPSATFALQRGSFVPREWLAAKGLLLLEL